MKVCYRPSPLLVTTPPISYNEIINHKNHTYPTIVPAINNNNSTSCFTSSSSSQIR